MVSRFAPLEFEFALEFEFGFPLAFFTISFQNATFEQTRVLRQLLSIVFGICLIVPFLGTWGWFHMEREAIRKQVKHSILAGIDRNELVLLAFTKLETKSLLDWKHAGEFEYRGQMYDIVEQYMECDSVYYFCWADHTETSLNTHLDKLFHKAIEKSSPQHQQSQKQFSDFIKSLYHHQSSAVIALSTFHSIRPRMDLQQRYFHDCSPPPSPPPKHHPFC